jgi:esterase/lipase
MNPPASETRKNEWLDYYKKFPYFSPEAIREGCYPRIMEHPSAEEAIVLVHGLTDSPYFMTAIGEHFFKLDYNVYLPLLHCHGLKVPVGMETVKLEEWKANVNYAVGQAKAKAKRVSIGGLSTGGTLSFYTAMTNPDITGKLYLFSAALDLAGGWKGQFLERLARFPGMANFLELFEKEKDLIGPNPYRYDHMDKDGARELARLIKETDALTRRFSKKNLIAKDIFAAHSESDDVASIEGIERMEKLCAPGRFTFFRIPKAKEVPHASVVLKEPVNNDGKVLETANPLFQEMLRATAS